VLEFWFTMEINAIGTIVEFLAMKTPSPELRIRHRPSYRPAGSATRFNGIRPRRRPSCDTTLADPPRGHDNEDDASDRERKPAAGCSLGKVAARNAYPR
jgi:hypothetical protein